MLQTITPPAASPRMPTDLVARVRESTAATPRIIRVHPGRIQASADSADAFDAVLLPAMPAAAAMGAAKGGLSPWQLARVRRHIDEGLERTILVDALASAVCLSSGHFCRAFKVSVGETPHAFLTRQRIRRAQTLMLRTRETLSQIACACGLTDQAHLTRLFRRIVGDTPMAWRRTWQDG